MENELDPDRIGGMAEARKTHDINHVDISYDYQKVVQRFEPTAAGLLTALTAACGQDPGAYTIEKQRQLAELGYENGQFEADPLVHFRSIAAIAASLTQA